RPRLPKNIRRLIIEMATNNPTWGQERVADELSLKLGSLCRPVVVSVGSEKLKGTLHVLSRTGGAIRLDKRCSPGTLADIAINTVCGSFSATIEFLQAANGRAQAFRFA